VAERPGSMESVEIMTDLDFYKGKKVLVTGHTGFKGSWLVKILADAGAQVTGYSLEPPTRPALFPLCKVKERIESVTGDIRDKEHLWQVLEKAKPEIVFHLAAQPIVRDSYKDPVYTYETNVMGTVYLLEGVRALGGVRSFLNVTTDKVYENREWEWGYRETDPLDGYDPYSNSKSCSELVTHSYRNSFFDGSGTAVSTARAGNVIGGGDFANDRIIPDCIRAAMAGEPVKVRNRWSIRPFQHVLEPLFAYLLIAKRQYEDEKYAGYYNVGPSDEDCITTGELTELFCRAWGKGQTWISQSQDGPHEASFLKLDCSRMRQVFGWKPRWNIEEAVKKTVEWFQVYASGGDVASCMEAQIREFMEEA